MRVLLFTGKGGVGKTTAAAATAALAASRGLKTLVVSTDAAHSLGDALGLPVRAEPTEVDHGLSALQVDVQCGFERAWRDVQDWLLAVLDVAGMDPIAAEELTVLPGVEEVLALLAVRDQVRSGWYDVVVVDCAPTAETVRLLALPEVLAWYLDRVFPVERHVVRSLRPLLTRAAGVPMPQDRVFDAVARLHAELADVRSVLADPAVTSVRLVLTQEAMVVAEARRTLTTLSLHGYRVDGVVANRVFPAAGADRWRARWVDAQARQLADVDASFAPLPVWRSRYHDAEPVGLEALTAFATQLYGDTDPVAVPAGPDPVVVERTPEGFSLALALPFAARGEVDLIRRGDELVVTYDSRRRVLSLP